MENLEKKLAQTLLNKYNFCERMLNESIIDKEYYTGQRVAIMSIAAEIFGEDITGQMPIEFLKNLEKIAK